MATGKGNGGKGSKALAELAKSLEAQGREVATLADHVGELRGANTAAAGRLAQLEERLGKIGERIDALEVTVSDLAKQTPGGVVMHRPPKALTADEVVGRCSEGHYMFKVLSPQPRLGLRAGDSFDARHRFAQPSLLASYVRGGLQLMAVEH